MWIWRWMHISTGLKFWRIFIKSTTTTSLISKVTKVLRYHEVVYPCVFPDEFALGVPGIGGKEIILLMIRQDFDYLFQILKNRMDVLEIHPFTC